MIGVSNVLGKGPQPLLRSGLRAARVQFKKIGVPNSLNYCANFSVYICI